MSPKPGDSEGTFWSSSQVATCPPYAADDEGFLSSLLMLNAQQESYTYQCKMIFSSGPKDALFNDFMIFECVYYMLL